jgi:asparagine synthase (glutamine-hydrolysing)
MDTITPQAVRAAAVFDPGAIAALISDHMERRINAGYHLWGLLTLFLWMKRWNVESPGAPHPAPRALAAR